MSETSKRRKKETVSKETVSKEAVSKETVSKETASKEIRSEKARSSECMSGDPMLLKNQLCFPMYAAAREVIARYTPYLKPLGLTYTQYLVLLVLWEENPMSVGGISRRLYLDNGTLTPVLKKMEKAGLIERRRSKDDERMVMIELTDTGKALREKAKGISEKVGCCVQLSPDEATTLYQLLYKVLDHVQNSKR